MDHTICNQVRFEIDEKDLGALLSASSIDHLRRCAECQEFQNKENKLRQIVGSLGTVNAPADFDFRLRARLANDSSLTSFHLASPLRLLRTRSFAVAALVVVFAGIAFVLWQGKQPQPTNQNTASRAVSAPVDNGRVASAGPSDAGVNPIAPPSAVTGVREQKRNSPQRKIVSLSSKRQTATVEMSGTGAQVIRSEQSMATAGIPLDVSQQSFKVLLDDGRGSSRTISVPAVSFGSRRVFASASMANQYAPKGDW